MTVRSTAERRRDVLARLAGDVDAWVPSSSADGRTHLVPLLFVWHGGRLSFATSGRSVTARNLARAGRARVALGPTRDVVVVDGTVEVEPVGAVAPDLADAYTRVGWDPREDSASVFLHVTPVRIQAWREADELAGRDVMVDGRWLA
ncbi:MAG TPA: pyridoxamine 5'-phosphate oxidase family protein [Acidimicrobiales bacterium]